MKLIVTEKDNAARRIAEILSDGRAERSREGEVNVYRWGGTRCVGLSGHVVGVDFPPEYDDWRDVQPHELVDADVEKRPTREDIVRSLRSLARRANRVIIATDYDREGELIGKEAYEIVRDVDEAVPIERVRFSSITENEVRSAFESPEELDFDLAAAGEARQIVDLLWGASLTRFLSLASNQLGEDFISVGRVQTPTLKLIVDREREIEAFDPDTYWELFAALTPADDESFEAQYFYLDADGNEAERVWTEAIANGVHERLRAAEGATVTRVDRRTRTDRPPIPFNTTQFIRAAGAVGFSAQRAMSIAEDLYTSGYITYPRTDNTVYPDDLDPRDLLEAFEGHHTFGEDASQLLDADELEPTRGDEETTDHPPIHPTGELPSRGDLSDREWTLYELVVRRFFATVADPARWAHLKVVAEADGTTDAAPDVADVATDEEIDPAESDEPVRLKANGKRLVEPGYHAVYPYFNTSENYVPGVEEGEVLDVADVRLEEKETQPPRRYGQSRLIETMEDLGLGTKATRHNILEKLYDRGYIEDDPPRPTQLARAVVEAAEEFAELIVSEEMTAQLEADMAAIAEGEATLEDVTAESREILEAIFADLVDAHDDVGALLRESMKADKTLGPCPECGEELLIRRSRRGSYFVGCDGYPDCEYTLPLPSTGKPHILEETCADHELAHVKMLAGRQTFVHGCPRCREAEAGAGPVLGHCPECGPSADEAARTPDPEDDRYGALQIKTLPTGSRLVGCSRYPECEYSLPLPRRGDIEVTEARCPDHDLPELVVHNGDEPWELGCPICNYHEYQRREEGSALMGLDGVGEKTVEKLADAGIETLEDLLEAEAEHVASSVEGVSADRIRQWQAKA